MRLTRRGIAAVGIVVVALAQGYLFGSRTLNYVAAPALAALVVGSLILWYTEDPTVTRSKVSPGFPGETRHETLTLDGAGIATISDSLPDGLGGEQLTRTVSLPTEIDREISLRERGVYRLGMLTVRQRDPLGLVTDDFVFDSPNALIVYPEIYPLDEASVHGALLRDGRSADGQAFDRLREYQYGDPLRRIHWTSSARHETLLVTESDPIHRTRPVHIVVDGRASVADELTAVAASLVVFVLDSGFEVSLTLPDVTVDSGRGDSHRRHLFEALARTGMNARRAERTDSSHLDQQVHDSADVLIFERNGDVIVRFETDDVPFDQLRAVETPNSLESPVQPGRTVSQKETYR